MRNRADSRTPAAARRACRWALGKNRKRPDTLMLLRHGAALFLVAELLHAAFASPRVAVRSVRVVGARRVPANAVAELAGVRPGRNIFCVNLALARARV